MMYIEGHWKFINSLSDISRIIREHYNYELADKMDELIPDVDYSDNEDFYDRQRLEELEEIIQEIRGLVI